MTITESELSITNILPRGPISPRAGEKPQLVHGLLTPMRDETLLSMDLIRPAAPGRYPVVLVRTPYDKTASRRPFYWELAERGYIVAIQDCRGRFNSDGDFFPYGDERPDGYDTVEWIAAQEWCDGSVGMAGRSYVAQTQWFAAAEAPPHLKAIVPECSPPDAFFNEPILNGCFLLPMGEWMRWMGRRAWQMPSDMPDLFSEFQDYFHATPLAALPARAGIASCPWWDEMMAHPNLDDFWRACSYQETWPRMDVAALNITGWWDMNFPGAPTNFAGLRRFGQTSRIRADQHLIIGPWWHHTNEDRALNGVDFGEQAIINLWEYAVRFYDHHLKGIANGIERDPRVHVFVLSENAWRTAADWPLPEAVPTPFYLHSRGNANSLHGDGVLSAEPPGQEPADTYDYDPANPAGSLWKLNDGPVDDRPATMRPDVLCYTSEPLTDPLDVIGPISCVLYASSSARDTDWHVRLVDVHPDGAARFLCHGTLRARFRESFETPRLLEPGQSYRFEFGVDAVGIRFLPGHRIRVEVASSWFPEYDRNTNTGSENNFLDDEWIVAHQRILHDSEHPSHVVLPVISTG